MIAYHFQLAWHSLRRGKLLALLMVLAIAAGIGTTMTMFAVAHVMSGDPLPGRSGQLFRVQVDPSSQERGREPPAQMDYPTARDLWSAHRARRQVMLYSSGVRVTGGAVRGMPAAAQMLSATSDFFGMFDVPFRHGGPWLATDDTGRARVAVISDELNRRLFAGGDSVGRWMRLGDTPVRIVGVLAPWRPALRFYEVSGGARVRARASGFFTRPEDVYTPFLTGLDINPHNIPVQGCWRDIADPMRMDLATAPCYWITLWAELPDASAARDYARFVAGFAGARRASGEFVNDAVRVRNLTDWLTFNKVVPDDVRLRMWMGGGFLLVCMFNTVCLLLARFMRRAGEIGVRRALGASRRAVFVQHLVEASVIGLLGGTGGWLVTLAGLWAVRQQATPYADLARLDGPMFLATFALAVLAALLAGVLPALRASLVTPSWQLKTL